jgi:hypothetical protein
MRNAPRRISRFVTAVASTVFHVVLLGDLGDPALEAGIVRRNAL